MSDGFIWEGAKVTYPDWTGTAQLDQRVTGEQLENLIGLGNAWVVVGLDIGGGETDHELRVVAVRSDDLPDGGDVFPKVAAAKGGEIPVTEFLVHDVDPYKILTAITHTFELRLRMRGMRDYPLRVVRQDDLPPQH